MSCFHRFRALALASGTIWLLAPTASAARVPPWIDSPDKEAPPAWVSAEEAAPGGHLRPGALPDSSRSRIVRDIATIKDYRARSGDDGVLTKSGNRCVTWTVLSDVKIPIDGQSIQELFAAAHRVVSGTLVDSAQGFVNGFPGTLLEILVENELKKISVRLPQRIFVHFEHAEVPIDGENICVRSSRYPDLPLVGNKILVFQRYASEEPVLHAHDTELIYERLDATPSLPPGLSQSWPQVESFNEFLSVLREAVQ